MRAEDAWGTPMGQIFSGHTPDRASRTFVGRTRRGDDESSSESIDEAPSSF